MTKNIFILCVFMAAILGAVSWILVLIAMGLELYGGL